MQCCLAAGGTPQGSGTACICSCGTTYDCSNPPDPQLTGGGKDDESAMPVPAGGPQQIVERGGGEVLPGEVYLDREYVYGPDYVDEFIAQFDRDGHAIFMLQDGNYNVVALVSGPGHPGGDDGQGNPQPLPTGTVLEQYTYEPYGALVAAELFHPHAMNRAGHQGLFFERFDGSYDDYTLFRVLQGTAFITGAKGLYYNRNRFYSPSLGRFTTRDPNETALPIITAMVMNGESLNILIGVINLRELYHDGMNLFQYVRSNPLRLTDPLGSFSIADAAVSMVIQSTISALVGGAAGGAFSWAMGGSMEDIEGAVLSGFTGGLAGGVAGFAASGAGLVARLLASGAADGMFSRMAQQYTTDSYSWRQVFADAISGAAISAVTHGILDGAGGVARKVLWGNWSLLPKVIRNGRTYAKIGDYLYTPHAINMMTPSGFGAAAGEINPGRGIPPDVVESVIMCGKPTVDGIRTRFFSDGVSVVVEEGSIVVTVLKARK